MTKPLGQLGDTPVRLCQSLFERNDGLPEIGRGCSFSGLAVFNQARCNAPMFLRRLIALFWPARPLPPRNAPAPVENRTALDLEEFGRLLSTGKAEDLKKIARDLGQRQPAPEVRRLAKEGD